MPPSAEKQPFSPEIAPKPQGGEVIAFPEAPKSVEANELKQSEQPVAGPEVTTEKTKEEAVVPSVKQAILEHDSKRQKSLDRFFEVKMEQAAHAFKGNPYELQNAAIDLEAHYKKERFGKELKEAA